MPLNYDDERRSPRGLPAPRLREEAGSVPAKHLDFDALKGAAQDFSDQVRAPDAPYKVGQGIRAGAEALGRSALTTGQAFADYAVNPLLNAYAEAGRGLLGKPSRLAAAEAPAQPAANNLPTPPAAHVAPPAPPAAPVNGAPVFPADQHIDLRDQVTVGVIPPPPGQQSRNAPAPGTAATGRQPGEVEVIRGAQRSIASGARQPGEVEVIRGTQRSITGAGEGSAAGSTFGRGERPVGISDPRVGEILGHLDSMIRNRPRNAFDAEVRTSKTTRTSNSHRSGEGRGRRGEGGASSASERSTEVGSQRIYQSELPSPDVYTNAAFGLAGQLLSHDANTRPKPPAAPGNDLVAVLGADGQPTYATEQQIRANPQAFRPIPNGSNQAPGAPAPGIQPGEILVNGSPQPIDSVRTAFFRLNPKASAEDWNAYLRSLYAESGQF